MKHTSLVTAHRASSGSRRKVASQDKTFEAYVEEAELCCEQARGALRCHRFGAAQGLLATATTLYQYALRLDGIAYPAVENRLRDIEREIQTAAAARHMSQMGLAAPR